MEPMRRLQQYFMNYTSEDIFFDTLREKISPKIDEYDFRHNIKRKI